MIVNYYFLYEQDYFDTEAAFKPLLHMWSLAVEEQFYLAAPVLLFVCWRARERIRAERRWLFPALTLAAFLASLAGCIQSTQPEKNYAFYVVLARVWEFIAGGAVLHLLPVAARLPRPALEAMGWLGLAAVAAAVVGFDEETPFPSYPVLLPAIGTALVILAGITQPGLRAARLLSWTPVVWIGLVSYSWYLWHWPLLSFLRIADFGNPNLVRDLAAVLAGLGLAAATYFLVERPILRFRRSRASPAAVRRAVGATVAASVMMLGLGFAYIRPVADRVEDAIPLAMRAEKDTKVMRGDPCWMYDPDLLQAACKARLEGKRVVVLFGDSHARMLYPALRALIAGTDLELVSLWRSGCSPFDIRADREPAVEIPACEAYTERGLATLVGETGRPPVLAVVGGYWAMILHGQQYADFVRRGRVTDAAGLAARSKELTGSFARLISRLEAMGVPRTLVLGPSAEFDHLPLDCVLRAERRGLGRDYCDVGRAEMQAWLAPVMAVLDEVTAASERVSLVDGMEAFCDGPACSSLIDGVLQFPDYHHASAAGAARLLDRPELRALFDRLAEDAATQR
jgi:hypothetical protein